MDKDILSKLADWLTFSNIAGLASIASMTFTIYVLYTLRNIRRYYVFTARGPELLTSLQSRSSRIKDLMPSFQDSIPEIEAELAQCIVLLKSLKRKVGRAEGRSISKVIKLIETKSKTSMQSKDVWSIYLEMLKLKEELMNLQEDYKWER